MDEALLDTDVVCHLMRRSPGVLAQARDYHQAFGTFFVSAITRYEIERGLKVNNAERQSELFAEFCSMSIVIPVSEDVACAGACIYHRLRSRGELLPDADILIAATALHAGLSLVTGNVKHFQRIAGLRVRQWNVS